MGLKRQICRTSTQCRKRFCPECGEAFKRNPKGRPKVLLRKVGEPGTETHPSGNEIDKKLICPVWGECSQSGMKSAKEILPRSWEPARAGKGKADETLL